MLFGVYVLSITLFIALPPMTSGLLLPLAFTREGVAIATTLTDSGKNVYAFLGVPYAKPPIGDLRFRKPEYPKPWGLLFANHFKPMCPQLTSNVSLISEDCLYLNIFTPANTTEPKPVMVFIHGGGFWNGNSNFNSWQYVVAKGDVVVVTVHYRLNVFGFLNLCNEDAPGNQGLWDQRLAMAWVHKQISCFGGDPKRITLFGESAGSISIAAHLLAPESRCHFNRAIMESGGAVSETIFPNRKDNRKKAVQFCKYTGCVPEDAPDNATIGPDAMQCLRNFTMVELFIKIYYYATQFPGASIQDTWPVEGDEFFQTSSGCQGKCLEAIIGVCRDEGTTLMQLALPFSFVDPTKQNITTNDAISFWKNRTTFKTNTDETDLIQAYFTETSDRPIDILQKLSGDDIITCPATTFSRFLASQGISVYFYEVMYAPSFPAVPDFYGVYHVAEGYAVTGTAFANPSYSALDKEFAEQIISKWSNFAKFGNPNDPGTQTWPIYSEENRVCLQLRPNNYTIGPEPREPYCNLWRNHLHIPHPNLQCPK